MIMEANRKDPAMKKLDAEMGEKHRLHELGVKLCDCQEHGLFFFTNYRDCN